MPNKLLDHYFKEKFFIIPIRKNEKRPLFKRWNEHQLSYDETRQYIANGFNIAVVAKDLTILDYDTRETFNSFYFRAFGTWVQFTPHGFHVFYRGEFPHSRGEYQFGIEADTIRHGDMYVLIAPSKVDGKSYWWLDDMKGEIAKAY